MMADRSAWAKFTAIVLSLLTIFVTVPFSLAEIAAPAPLGSIVTSGRATVGNNAAPTGTTIFAGDKVTSNEPALINLKSGSRIEITKAAASFSRQGQTLIVDAGQGLLRFNFKKGEEVQINAGQYSLTTASTSGHVGELGLNRRGQIGMDVTEGSFTVMNTATGERTEVSPNNPLMVMTQIGQGSLAKSGQSITDNAVSLKPNELKGKCVVAGGEAYPITGNTTTVIAIKGNWKIKTGNYPYQIVDCTKEALAKAGASQTTANDASSVAVFGAKQSKTGVSHARRNILIIAGIGGAAGAGIGLAAGGGDKSPSAR